MTTSRIGAVALALSIAFGFVGGAGSTQGSAKDQTLSGAIASSKRQSLHDGQYDRLEAHGIYWTGSENDPITAPFYNVGKGSHALHRGPQGQTQMAVSVRCVRQ